MTEETQTTESQRAMACPKDGTEMVSMGRRPSAWRCPACKAVLLDVEAMRRGREGKPPAWAPVVWSVVMSVLATVIVRRLRRRPKP